MAASDRRGGWGWRRYYWNCLEKVPGKYISLLHSVWYQRAVWNSFLYLTQHLLLKYVDSLTFEDIWLEFRILTIVLNEGLLALYKCVFAQNSISNMRSLHKYAVMRLPSCCSCCQNYLAPLEHSRYIKEESQIYENPPTLYKSTCWSSLEASWWITVGKLAACQRRTNWQTLDELFTISANKIFTGMQKNKRIITPEGDV